MSNVFSILKNSDGKEFTHEVPESDTLLSLACIHSIRAFQMEHIEFGNYMCMAHFDHDGWHHLYQAGDGRGSSHLFFFVVAWQGEKSPQVMALEFFKDQFAIYD